MTATPAGDLWLRLSPLLTGPRTYPSPFDLETTSSAHLPRKTEHRAAPSCEKRPQPAAAFRAGDAISETRFWTDGRTARSPRPGRSGPRAATTAAAEGEGSRGRAPCPGGRGNPVFPRIVPSSCRPWSAEGEAPRTAANSRSKLKRLAKRRRER